MGREGCIGTECMGAVSGEGRETGPGLRRDGKGKARQERERGNRRGYLPGSTPRGGFGSNGHCWKASLGRKGGGHGHAYSRIGFSACGQG